MSFQPVKSNLRTTNLPPSQHDPFSLLPKGLGDIGAKARNLPLELRRKLGERDSELLGMAPPYRRPFDRERFHAVERKDPAHELGAHRDVDRTAQAAPPR